MYLSLMEQARVSHNSIKYSMRDETAFWIVCLLISQEKFGFDKLGNCYVMLCLIRNDIEKEIDGNI